MTHILDPFRFLLIAFSGWMNDRQLLLIDYLREENRVLRNSWAASDCVSLTTSAAGWRSRRRTRTEGADRVGYFRSELLGVFAVGSRAFNSFALRECKPSRR